MSGSINLGIPDIAVVLRENTDTNNVVLDVPNISVTVEHAPDYKVSVQPSSLVVQRTGSLPSLAVSALFANTASYALAVSGSIDNAISASFATTSSFALNAGSGVGFPFSGSAVITGSLKVSGSITSSHIVPAITDIYDLGSPTLKFRDLYLSGSTLYLGSLAIRDNSGALSVSPSGSPTGTNSPISGAFTGSFLGNLIGNVNTATTASFATTASYALLANNAVSSSFATTASYAVNAASVPAGTVSSSAQVVTYVSGSTIVPNRVESNEYKLIAGAVSLIFTGSITSGIFGATEYVLPFIPTSSFSAATVEYVASRVGGLRVGIILAGWSGNNTTVTDVSSTDVGDTSDINFSLVQDSGYIKLRVESLGSGSYPWTVQSLFKLFPTLS